MMSYISHAPGMRIVLLISLNLACMLILQMFDGFKGMSWLLPDPEEKIPLSLLRLGNAVGSLLVYAIPALVIVNIFPAERFQYLRLHTNTRPLWIILAALSLVLCLYAADPFYDWLRQMMTNPNLLKELKASEQYNQQLLNMESIPDLLICLFIVALIPAFAEELFFRAVFQQTLRESTKNGHIAIWVTALIFAFLHTNPIAIPIIFAMGLLLGYLFFWTGSLRTNTVAHFSFNAVSIINMYSEQHYPYSLYTNWEPSWPIAVGMVLLNSLFLLIIYRQTRMHPDMLL
jgi:hypothetical protein